jgi:Zn-finger nucleic acid-binding protein
MELTCPKCDGAMRSYERSGIVIDQCSECRGVFLDRGELAKLIDAESREMAAPAWGTSDPRQQTRPDDDRYPYDDDRYRYDDDHRYGKKKKRSFLEDLFD